MIPLRRKAVRAWWTGFLIFAGLFLGLGILLNDPLLGQATTIAKRFSPNDAVAALAFIPTMLVLTVVVGSIGGNAASAIYLKRSRGVQCSSTNEE